MSGQRDNQVDLDHDGVWPADQLVEDFPLCVPPVVPTAGQLALARAAAIQVIHGPQVLPHVEAAAFHVADATGVTWISTYNGHHPSAAEALDIFHQIADHRLSKAICDWLWEHREEIGLWYLMSRSKIRNVLVADGAWRDVADRGSPTANHDDHVHASFFPSASARREEDAMNQEERDQLNWLHDMVKRMTAGLADDDYQAAERLNERVRQGPTGSAGGKFRISGTIDLEP